MTRLVGRDEELAAVEGALDHGGCVIAGPAGVGKSRLAAEAARSFDQGRRPVVRVVATEAAASIPFGAFSHLLPVGQVPDSPAIPLVIRWLRERPDGPPILLVDDAHLLDAASAALVLAVAGTRAATVLATLRSPEPAPDAIVSLWKEHGLARIDLQALARREVRVLVDDVLGGLAHAHVYERAYELSQGNPLFITELLLEGRRTGALTMADGRWWWTGDPLASARLHDLIGIHLRGLSTDARRTLELLAIGAPLLLAHVEALVVPSAIEELERSGIAVATGSGRGDGRGPVVELAHPLYGEVISAQIPATVGRRLRRQLAEALARESDLSEMQRLRIATWLLEAGEVHARAFVEASTIALRRGAPVLADRLAEAAGDGMDARLCLAQARIALARFDDVESILAPLEPEASMAAPVVGAAYVETRLRALMRGSGEAPEPVALVDRSEGWHDTADWAALVVSQRAWAALHDGRPALAFARLKPFLADSGLGAQRHFQLLAVAVYALGRLGRVDEFQAVERQVAAVAHRLEGRPWEAGLLGLLGDMAVRIDAACDLAAVGDRLEKARLEAEATGDGPLASTILVALGGLALTRGHVEEALRRIEAGIDGLALADPAIALPSALGVLAQARGLAGDAAGAARAVEQGWAILGGRPRLARRWGPGLERGQVWADVAAGRLSSARDRYLALAEGAGEDVVTAADALHGALRLGARPGFCAERLAAVSEGGHSELYSLYTRQARAMADGSAPDQLEVALSFDDLGLDLLAAEAATGAAVLARANGRRDLSRRAAAVAARCAQRCQGARTPALSIEADAPRLSRREREIGLLAARGLANAEIAETLTLSIRTVETYVLRTCRKLGVKDRRDLAGVIDP